MSSEVKLLDAVAATGASNSWFLPFAKSKHTVSMTVVDANAGISAITLKLQGSHNGRDVTDANATWYDLAEHAFSAAELTALAAMFHVTDKPVGRIRLNLTTLTGNGAGDTLTGIYNNGEI